MLRKLLSIGLLCSILSIGANAQKRASRSGGTFYNNALGLHVEFGNGGSQVGPTIKHFFNQHSAGQFMLLFGNNEVALDFEYQYHGQVQNANGLQWYVGMGPTIGFWKRRNDQSETRLYLRPVAGLDYKLDHLPLDFAFDWRPTFQLTPNRTDKFNAARFGLGIRFTF